MHTQMATTTGHHEHPPEPVHPTTSHAVRRVGLLDRGALHLGIALIKWGRRPVRQTASAIPTEMIAAREEAERIRAHHQATILTRML